jgi:uncharacterized membrane protein YkvA (DUF1232 family)
VEVPSFLARLKGWAARFKRDIVALWLAARDPRVPWYVKFASGAVAAYALSPIDLIPDFIPVIGYLDDLILLPLAIAAIVRLIPPPVLSDLRAKADRLAERPRSRAAAAAIVLVWVAAAAVLSWAAFRWWGGAGKFGPVARDLFALWT